MISAEAMIGRSLRSKLEMAKADLRYAQEQVLSQAFADDYAHRVTVWSELVRCQQLVIELQDATIRELLRR